MKHMIRAVINSIKLRIFNKLILELCAGNGCLDCKAYSSGHCALPRAIDLALETWGYKKGNDANV